MWEILWRLREQFREYARISYQVDFSRFQMAAETERINQLIDYFEHSGPWTRMGSQLVFRDYQRFVWTTYSGCLGNGSNYAWYSGIIFKHQSGTYIAVMVPWQTLRSTGEIQRPHELVSSRPLSNQELDAFATELLEYLQQRTFYNPKTPTVLAEIPLKNP